MCHTRGKNRLKYGLLVFFGGAVPFRTPFPTAYFTSSLPFSLCAICPPYVESFFVMGMVSAQREVLRFVGMGSVLRSKESTTKSSCADESHPKDSGRFYGDVTPVCPGFCDVIYVRLVKITSPRNLRRKSLPSPSPTWKNKSKLNEFFFPLLLEIIN